MPTYSRENVPNSLHQKLASLTWSTVWSVCCISQIFYPDSLMPLYCASKKTLLTALHKFFYAASRMDINDCMWSNKLCKIKREPLHSPGTRVTAVWTFLTKGTRTYKWGSGCPWPFLVYTQSLSQTIHGILPKPCLNSSIIGPPKRIPLTALCPCSTSKLAVLRLMNN